MSDNNHGPGLYVLNAAGGSFRGLVFATSASFLWGWEAGCGASMSVLLLLGRGAFREVRCTRALMSASPCCLRHAKRRPWPSAVLAKLLTFRVRTNLL